MYKIFIAEDDKTIAETLKRHLEKWDYRVRCAQNFQRVLEEFQETSPDLVLLDIGLPFFNGLYWCSEIRKISSVPIVFISSANDNIDIVMAMNMGGDEFIEKPFDLNVVTAKVQAILRRAYGFRGQENVMQRGELTLNLGDATISVRGKKTELTKNEFKILQILMENAGKIVTRDDIIGRLWESDEFVDENTLTVNVARLRKKLSITGLDDVIATKKGIGYMVEA